MVTRSQSKSSEWFEARTWRITGSKCGKILLCPTEAFVMYYTHFKFLPPAIKCGQQNEKNACAAYISYMRTHTDLKTRPCGFKI